MWTYTPHHASPLTLEAARKQSLPNTTALSFGPLTFADAFGIDAERGVASDSGFRVALTGRRVADLMVLNSCGDSLKHLSSRLRPQVPTRDDRVGGIADLLNRPLWIFSPALPRTLATGTSS